MRTQRSFRAWTVVRTIVGKDLTQRLRDRSAYVAGLVAPLGLAVVLNLTFGAGASSSPGLEFGLVDDDRGQVAEEFASMARSLGDDGVANVRPFADEAAGAAALDRGEVSAVFVLPVGLSDGVLVGRPAVVRVLADSERPTGARVASGVAEGFVAEVDGVGLAVATVGALAPEVPSAEVIVASAAAPRPIIVTDDAVAGRGFDLTTYYAISISVFFLFFTVQFGVLGLMEERSGGTLARLLAAPIGRSTVLVGKLGAAAVVGCVSMALLVASTTVLLGATWGGVVPVALLVLAGIASALALTALVGTIARTTEQASSWSTFVALGMGMLGGSFFPLAFAPEGINLLSRLTPHRWLLEGFRDASFGGGVREVVPSLVALGVFVAVTGGLALARSDRLIPRR